MFNKCSRLGDELSHKIGLYLPILRKQKKIVRRFRV